MKQFLRLIATVCVAGLVCGFAAPKDDVEKRVEKLLAKMTLEEKIGQMNQLSYSREQPMVSAAKEGKVGSILNLVDPAVINRIQRAAVEESRLGIPVLFSRDVIHGFKTIFPIPLGLAASFDPEMVEAGARVAAEEATAAGIRWTFSPMLDIARDPRWGRVAEGSGEDPYLDSRMAEAMVRGYQTDNLADPTAMAACVKHFVGYGAAEGGRDYNSTNIPPTLMHNVYLPPFEAAVKAGAQTAMTSFNDNDGIPATGNRYMLRDVLRESWGFDGFVVTDWNSAGEMVVHGFAEDNKDAGRIALNAGVDMDMTTGAFINYIPELLEEGKVKMEDVDNAVRNILRVKFRLGLFENPYVEEGLTEKEFYAPDHLEVAKKSAEESVILLQNNNNVLPLKSVKRLVVAGPLADAPYDQLGTWIFDGDQRHTVTPLAALRDMYGKDVEIIYEPGVKYVRSNDTADIPAAVAATKGADAVVVFVGEEARLSGEAHSLANIDLLGAQSQLLAELKATGKPVVAVVMAGRPMTIGKDLANCDAMLYSFHPGTMGGPAIADLLFGKAVPSAKTPMSFLRVVGQVPLYYNHNMGGRPTNRPIRLLADLPVEQNQTSVGGTSNYLDVEHTPLFPFGYGLSYTTFEYSNVKLDKEVYGMNDVIRVEFDLANTGNYDATEVAQLYTRDLVGSVARPVRELKKFDRITLKAGESKHIVFELPVADLAFYNSELVKAVEPGKFQLWVAGDSNSGKALNFEVK